MNFEVLFSQAIIACQSCTPGAQALADGQFQKRNVSSLPQQCAQSSGSQPSSMGLSGPPPTPLTVVAAAEKCLTQLAASGKVLHVVVVAHAGAFWPSSALQLLRECLLHHLQLCAGTRCERLVLCHASAVAALQAMQPAVASQSDSSAELESHTVQDHLSAVFPSAVIAAQHRSLCRQLQQLLPAALQGMGSKRDGEVGIAWLPLALHIANMALASGSCGVPVASIVDTYSHGSGTFAPIRNFMESVAARSGIQQHLHQSQARITERLQESSATRKGSMAQSAPGASSRVAQQQSLQGLTRAHLASVAAGALSDMPATLQQAWQLQVRCYVSDCNAATPDSVQLCWSSRCAVVMQSVHRGRAHAPQRWPVAQEHDAELYAK